MNETRKKIIVYSCSGCSSAAQTANALALKLDRNGIAEMSCIAGVGGGIDSLVKKAQSADVIIGIDGCPLQCVAACLKQQGLKSNYHYDLSHHGITKNFHQDFDTLKAAQVYSRIVAELRLEIQGNPSLHPPAVK